MSKKTVPQKKITNLPLRFKDPVEAAFVLEIEYLKSLLDPGKFRKTKQKV